MNKYRKVREMITTDTDMTGRRSERDDQTEEEGNRNTRTMR